MEEFRIITQSDNAGFVPVLQPEFVVLGMLDEYCGRQVVEASSTVERFFSDERPLVEVFARYLSLYGRSVDVDPAGISIVHAESGHAYVESSLMNAHVNSLYRFEFEPGRVMTMLNGQKHRYAHVALGIEDFPKKSSILYKPSEMNPRFSYLYGVLLRFGQDGFIVKMANASQKIELIKRVLEELDVTWVEHRYTVGGAPTCHQVAFGADDRLDGFLRSALAERTEAFAGAAFRG